MRDPHEPRAVVAVGLLARGHELVPAGGDARALDDARAAIASRRHTSRLSPLLEPMMPVTPHCERDLRVLRGDHAQVRRRRLEPEDRRDAERRPTGRSPSGSGPARGPASASCRRGRSRDRPAARPARRCPRARCACPRSRPSRSAAAVPLPSIRFAFCSTTRASAIAASPPDGGSQQYSVAPRAADAWRNDMRGRSLCSRSRRGPARDRRVRTDRDARDARRAPSARSAADPIAELPDGLHVALCGAGGPMPSANRSGPCVAVVAGRTLFVVDAGTNGARNLQGVIGWGPGRVAAVFLTHYHSDHIDGLGELGLLRWVGGSHRDPLPLYGPEGLRRRRRGLRARLSARRALPRRAPRRRGRAARGRRIRTRSRSRRPRRARRSCSGSATALARERVPRRARAGRLRRSATASTTAAARSSSAATRRSPTACSRRRAASTCSCTRRSRPSSSASCTTRRESAGNAKLAKMMTDIPDYHTTPVRGRRDRAGRRRAPSAALPRRAAAARARARGRVPRRYVRRRSRAAIDAGPRRHADLAAERVGARSTSTSHECAMIAAVLGGTGARR